LVYANWLPQVDRPAHERARIAIRKPNVIFVADATAPPAARAIPPQELASAIKHTLLAERFFHAGPNSDATQDAWSQWYWQPDGVLARESRMRAVLIVKLAAELYRREQGKPPVNAGALVGSYLKELPESFARDDLIPKGLD
jgi:hypothetical protein